MAKQGATSAVGQSIEQTIADLIVGNIDATMGSNSTNATENKKEGDGLPIFKNGVEYAKRKF